MRPIRSRKIRDGISAYLFLSPFLLIFLVFLCYPVFYSLFLSFHSIESLDDVFGGLRFVGLANFRRLFQDLEFGWALLMTLYYALLSVPFGLVASLALALLLNNRLRMRALFRSFYFLPYVMDMLVVGIVWTLLYSAPYGILNRLLEAVGIHFFSHTGFLGNSATAIPSMVGAMILKNVGFGMILLLAAIQNIPDSVYEAADIDGASGWQKLVRITIPLIKPVILFMVLIGIIGSLSAFAEIYAMTSGGPNVNLAGRALGATKVTGYFLYTHFRALRLGYAAAISWVILLITLVLSLVNMRLFGEETE